MMKSSWLIQRLRKPQEDKFINPFSFGAGGGRLTKEARQALREAFDYDYMGAAEFEFGAVREALEQIFDKRGSFVTAELEIPTSSVRIESWEKHHYKKPEGKKTLTVFIFCQKEHLDEVKELVIKLATDENSKTLKERTMLRYKFLEALDGYQDNIGGWLELDNGFFFFTDERMFRNTVRFFGMETEKVK